MIINKITDGLYRIEDFIPQVTMDYVNSLINETNDFYKNHYSNVSRGVHTLSAESKYQISPRFALSYQVGQAALLRFSYGHFFQMPPLYAMYSNSNWLISPNNYATILGNPNLEAEKTVQYEIGIWQKLNSALDSSEKNIPAFNQKMAFQHLLDQCSYGPRNPGSEGHQEFSKYLEEYLSSLSKSVIIQEFSYTEHLTTKKRKGKNLIAQFNLESEERLLLGAHWDTRSLSDEDPDEEKKSLPVLGANDGASGTAVLMELASIFSKNNPPIGIDIVFFDDEDVGINGKPYTFAMGSEYFSKNLPIEKPNFAIIVDMVGDKSLKIPIERFSYQVNPEMVKEIWSLANDLGLNAFEYRVGYEIYDCLLYTSPSPRDLSTSRMPSSA